MFLAIILKKKDVIQCQDISTTTRIWKFSKQVLTIFSSKKSLIFFFESLKTNTLKQFHLEANFSTVSLIFEEFYWLVDALKVNNSITFVHFDCIDKILTEKLKYLLYCNQIWKRNPLFTSFQNLWENRFESCFFKQNDWKKFEF